MRVNVSNTVLGHERAKIHVTWKLRASFEKELDVCVPRDKLWDLTAERLWTV